MEMQPDNGILEEFRVEFLACWERLPNKALFLVLLAAWALLFLLIGNSTLGYIHTPSLYAWLWDTYLPPNVEAREDSHGPLVILAVLGLFWWKRKELLNGELRCWTPGLLLVVAGLLLHVLGFLAQQPRLSAAGLFLGIYGLMGLAWGPAWLREAFFPFFLLGFAIPTSVFLQSITFPLQLLVCKIVEAVCHFVSIDIIRDGALLLDPTRRYQYEVAAACSGIRSLVAIFAFSVVYSWMAFGSWWQRGLLAVAAIPLAVLGNTLRMLAIIFAAEVGGQSAGNYVHDSSLLSLIPYVAAFFGLFSLAQWLRKHERKPKAGTPAKSGTP